MSRRGLTGEVGGIGALIDRLERSSQRVGADLAHKILRFGNHDGVCMLEGLFRHERGMIAAQNHRDATPAELRRDGVGALGRVGLDRHGHPRGGAIEGDLLKRVVVKLRLPIGRQQAGDDRQRQGFQAEGVDVELLAVAAETGLDEQDPFHVGESNPSF